MCRLIISDTDSDTIFCIWVASVIELFCTQDLLAADDDQQLIVWHAEHLVRGEEPAPAKPLGIAVLGDDLGDGNALACGYGGIHFHRHITAAGAEILRRNIVGTAEHELRVGIAQQFCPEIVWIPVLHLRQVLTADRNSREEFWSSKITK